MEYVWRGPYEERQKVRAVGFTWDKDRKVWLTMDPYIAARVMPVPGVRERIERSWATRPSYLEPDGLYPYQAAGVEYMAERYIDGARVMFLADEPGLGKTPQTCRLADRIGWRNLLVICPASLRINWVREIQRWRSLGSEPVAVMDGKTEPGGTTVVSYDLALRMDLGRKYDALILDEAHYLKSTDAKRTRAILGRNGLSDQIGDILLLSGTPYPNSPMEIHHILNKFVPGLAPKRKLEYAYRYTIPVQQRFGWRFMGSRNEEDLYTRLRGSGFLLRRLKKDVLKDLPPKRYKLAVFPKDRETAKVLEREKSFSAAEIVAHGVPVGSALPEIRREMGVAKLPVALAYIKDMLDGGVHKVVIGAWHKEVISGLMAGLAPYGAVEVHGGTPGGARQMAVDRFQESLEVRCFVGQLQAAGTGITLTAASDVVLVEPDWVPGVNDQFADRCHRIGQRDSVLVHLLVIEESLDAKILGDAARKAEGISKSLDNLKL